MFIRNYYILKKHKKPDTKYVGMDSINDLSYVESVKTLKVLVDSLMHYR